MNFGIRYQASPGHEYSEAALAAGPWSTLIIGPSTDFAPEPDIRISATDILTEPGGNVDELYGYLSFGRMQAGIDAFAEVDPANRVLSEDTSPDVLDIYDLDFWTADVIDALSGEIAVQTGQGFQGVFLDDFDRYYIRKDALNAEIGDLFDDDDLSNAALAAMDGAVQLANAHPGQKFIVNVPAFLFSHARFGDRGLDLGRVEDEIDAFAAAVDGVLVESYLANSTNPDYQLVLSQFLDEGLDVYVSEVFGAGFTRQDVLDYYADTISRGFIPTATSSAAFDRFDPAIPILNEATTGRDIFAGFEGGLTAAGLAGDDTYFAGSGADSFEGGAGQDSVIYATAEGAVGVSLTDPGMNSGDAAGDAFAGIEILEGGGFDDILRGSAVVETLRGGDGRDTLAGRGSVDLLEGGAGNDVLLGGGGDDILLGGAGADFIRGDAGEDRVLYVDEAAAVTVDLTDDAINSGAAAGDTILLVENIDGSDFGDDLRGDAEGNHLRGRDGNDTLRGRGGDDLLEGGRGADVLIGQGGADMFLFTGPNQGVDTINDFASGIDSIAVLGSAFGGLPSGALPASRFVTGPAATDASDRFVYNEANGRLFFDGDGSGARAAKLLAVLAGAPTLTAADFEVV